VSGQNSNERSKGQQKQEGGVDVLLCMFVTAAVFHLEMSTLNAEAEKNAVGGCRCRGGYNPKINKSRKRKKKSNGSEWTEFK
jgi:hypothetical protein